MSWASEQIDKLPQAHLLRDACDFALTQGLVKRFPNVQDSNVVTHYPITLLPTPFPASSYHAALDLQPIVNELYCKIANDFEFLQETLNTSTTSDEFVARLLDIHKTCVIEGTAQPVSCCISRADYMLERKQKDGNKFRLRQVEVNTIAAGLPSPCHKVQKMHNYLMHKYRLAQCLDIEMTDQIYNRHAIKCKPLALVERGLISAYDIYNKPHAWIVFVIEDLNWNFSDYFHMELAIFKQRPDIRLQRVKFSQMHNKLQLGPNKELLLRMETSSHSNLYEIAVVYFRTCYDPVQFCANSEAWNSRLLIERSRAIKCPSIGYHLAGAKKFQQVLNTSQKLQKYLEPEKANKLAKSFCKMWPLDRESIQIALDPSNDLVLKPQREGGGNNIFGANVIDATRRLMANSDGGLDSSNSKHAFRNIAYTSYILMERIDCVKESNWFLEPNGRAYSEPALDKPCDVSSELGIFGLTLADGLTLVRNETSGYLLRSKRFGSSEGGVSNGSAAISSLMLFDDDHEIFRHSYSAE